MKKVKLLYTELGVADLAALEQAACGGAFRALPGFGAKSEARILRGIAWLRGKSG